MSDNINGAGTGDLGSRDINSQEVSEAVLRISQLYKDEVNSFFQEETDEYAARTAQNADLIAKRGKENKKYQAAFKAYEEEAKKVGSLDNNNRKLKKLKEAYNKAKEALFKDTKLLVKESSSLNREQFLQQNIAHEAVACKIHKEIKSFLKREKLRDEQNSRDDKTELPPL